MKEELGEKITEIIKEKVEACGRPDLFRQPLVAFSTADDERYLELKKTIGEWHLTPVELFPEAKSVISYFVPFTKEVTGEPKTVADGSPLWGDAYYTINSYFDQVNQALVDYLSGLGFSSQMMAATHTYDPKELKAPWSHRSAAAIAGLGAFGANRMVITEKGSGGRFSTVLTAAPLEANAVPAPNRCLYLKNGSCGLCFKVCPVGALKADSFAKFVCQDELNKNDEKQREVTGRWEDTCGKCISVCPLAYIK